MSIPENKPITILRGRLNGAQRNRLRSLLDMLYRPSELAKEVGFNKQQVYQAYIPLGCPHRKDKKGHIWINGQHFREWYEETYRKTKLKNNEAYCLTCLQAVEIVNPTHYKKGGMTYLLCDCPQCGRKLARILTMETGEDD